MMVINIKDQIKKWEEESDDPDYWSESIGFLKEFQKLSGVEKYINDDAEDYEIMSCYTELLKGMSEIIAPDLQITDIKASVQEGLWCFDFNINGQANRITMPPTGMDWINFDFMTSVNTCLENAGSEKRIRLVYPTSEINRDQCFDMAFIDDETTDILAAQSPSYAEGIHRGYNPLLH